MYRVIPDSAVSDQIAVLPAPMLPLIAEAFGVLELAPESGRPYNDDLPNGPMRELILGPGSVAITYLIVEHVREVHILLVQYLG